MEIPGVAGRYDTYPLGWKFQGCGGSEAKGPSMGRGRGGYGYFLELHNIK